MDVTLPIKQLQLASLLLANRMYYLVFLHINREPLIHTYLSCTQMFS